MLEDDLAQVVGAPALSPPTFIITVEVNGAPGSPCWITHVHAYTPVCTHTHRALQDMVSLSVPLFGMARVSGHCVHSASHMPEKLL